jgi:hypothetical protein
MNSSLGFTIKSINKMIFKECSSKIQQFYFAIAYLYNSNNVQTNDNYIVALHATLTELQPYFKQHQIIPTQFISQISQHLEKIKHDDIETLWRLLALIIDDWNILCQYNH